MKLTASLPLKIAGKGRLRSFLFGVSAISWGAFAVFVLGYQYHGHAKVFLGSRFKQRNSPIQGTNCVASPPTKRCMRSNDKFQSPLRGHLERVRIFQIRRGFLTPCKWYLPGTRKPTSLKWVEMVKQHKKQPIPIGKELVNIVQLMETQPLMDGHEVPGSMDLMTPKVPIRWSFLQSSGGLVFDDPIEAITSHWHRLCVCFPI